MATYIDLNALSEQQISEILKTRVVKEFADARIAEQRGAAEDGHRLSEAVL